MLLRLCNPPTHLSRIDTRAVPNCPGAKISRCQNFLVPNCPSAKLSRCQLPAPNYPGAKIVPWGDFCTERIQWSRSNHLVSFAEMLTSGEEKSSMETLHSQNALQFEGNVKKYRNSVKLCPCVVMIFKNGNVFSIGHGQTTEKEYLHEILRHFHK